MEEKDIGVRGKGVAECGERYTRRDGGRELSIAECGEAGWR